jgi:hypothetical protein
MNSSLALLRGPAQACRIKDKLTRWQNSITSLIKQDTNDGLWPATEPFTGDWVQETQQFRDMTVKAHIDMFKESITCAREYNADGWDDPAAIQNVAGIINVQGSTFPGWCQAPARQAECRKHSGKAHCPNMCGTMVVKQDGTFMDDKGGMAKCIDAHNFCSTNMDMKECSGPMGGDCTMIDAWFQTAAACCEAAPTEDPSQIATATSGTAPFSAISAVLLGFVILACVSC